MIDADIVGAIALVLVALALTVWGIAKALGENSAPGPASPREPVVMSDRERRYHESNQFGR